MASFLQNCWRQSQCFILNAYSQISGFWFGFLFFFGWFGFFVFLFINLLYLLFISVHRCWGNALRSWRLGSIWDAEATVTSLSGGCLGAWQKVGSVQEFIFWNCCPMAPVCLFATFHPVLQIWQPSGQRYVFCHNILRNTLCRLSKQQQGRVLLVVKVHNTDQPKKNNTNFGTDHHLTL